MESRFFCVGYKIVLRLNYDTYLLSESRYVCGKIYLIAFAVRNQMSLKLFIQMLKYINFGQLCQTAQCTLHVYSVCGAETTHNIAIGNFINLKFIICKLSTSNTWQLLHHSFNGNQISFRDNQKAIITIQFKMILRWSNRNIDVEQSQIFSTHLDGNQIASSHLVTQSVLVR